MRETLDGFQGRLQIGGRMITNLRYADDIILLATSEAELQRTKFRKDRSNRYRDITIFVIFKMAAAAILNFQKFEILTVDPL